MNLRIELSEDDMKGLILAYIQEKTGNDRLDFSCVRIEVKSKQNFRAEWETAKWRAVYEQHS